MSQRITGRPKGAYDTTRPWWGLDGSWMERGNCSGMGHERRQIFFMDEAGDRVQARLATEEAKLVCLDCPVKQECLDYAIQGNMYGVWGGLTKRERQRL